MGWVLCVELDVHAVRFCSQPLGDQAWQEPGIPVRHHPARATVADLAGTGLQGGSTRLHESGKPAMTKPFRPWATAGMLLTALPGLVHASDTVGEVDTVFKFIGPDHKIVVEAYDDPKVNGVTCFVSRAKTGGIKGALGLAEDRSEASIACRQVGPISFAQPLPRQDEVFTERMSLIFKKLRIVRMVDARRNTLVYLTYSDRVIEGSPQNSVTAVAVDRGTPIPLR
jgi:CreA protein